MNVLLTGATGFVGQNFIEYLKKEKSPFKIFAVSRKINNKEYPEVKWIKFEENLEEIFTKYQIDAIIHLLGKAHDTKNTSAAEEYFQVNYEYTKNLFDVFVNSQATKFIFLSTIKATGDNKTYVRDSLDLTEPQTPYAVSKRKAEEYIQNFSLPPNKYYYILRPTLIYGPLIKGNLALLVKFVKNGLPYPFEAFENKRSYLSANNLSFIFCTLLQKNYQSLTLNVANEDSLSTKELMTIIAMSLKKKPAKLTIPKAFINVLAKVGDVIPFPLNTEKLKKITSSFIVDTTELNKTLNIKLPETTRDTISVITKY